MEAQKTIAPGTRVVVWRADGQPMEGMILEPPVQYLLPFGEWYVVHRSAPVKYAGKTRKKQDAAWSVDQIGLYPRYKIQEVRA